MTIASFVISLLALVVAAVSVVYARRQSLSQGKATAIEDDRRHNELTPVFEASCEIGNTGGYGDLGDSATLKITLSGGTVDLDEVVITIQDEIGTDHWGRGLPDGVTRQQAEAFVWGPWEFDTNPSAQVASNRQTRPRAYSLTTGNNWDVLTLAATRPGPWVTGITLNKWTTDRRQQPVRLLLTCRRDGHKSWLVPLEVRPRLGPPSYASPVNPAAWKQETSGD
jgi:hypothetical protein